MKKKVNGKETKDDALVKVSRSVYDQIKKKINEDRVEFPSIKNFVEKSVKQLLDFDKQIKDSINRDHVTQANNENHKGQINVHSQQNHHRIPSGVG